MIDRIVSEINNAIEAGNPVSGNIELYGIAKIHELEEERYPAIRIDKDWYRISLDDRNDLTAYHRIEGITLETDDEFDFSSSVEENSEVYDMVMIIALNGFCYSEEKVSEIRKLFPGVFNGYGFINTTEIETDQDEIVSDEWGSISYLDHKTPFNVYRIKYEVQIINCHG